MKSLSIYGCGDSFCRLPCEGSAQVMSPHDDSDVGVKTDIDLDDFEASVLVSSSGINSLILPQVEPGLMTSSVGLIVRNVWDCLVSLSCDQAW